MQMNARKFHSGWNSELFVYNFGAFSGCIALGENRPQVYNLKHLKPANEHKWKFGRGHYTL